MQTTDKLTCVTLEGGRLPDLHRDALCARAARAIAVSLDDCLKHTVLRPGDSVSATYTVHIDPIE